MKYRLYKIVSEDDGYMFYEYVCPEINDKKIEINKPTELVEYEYIEDLTELYNEGLIPEMVADVLGTKMNWIDNYFIATEIDGKYVSKCLKFEDGMLYGSVPDKYTHLRRKLFMMSYLCGYFSLVLLILYLLVRNRG